MKKKIWIGLILLIIGLFLINNPKTIVKIEKKEVFDSFSPTKTASVDIEQQIEKTGEDNEFLPGVEFTLSSYNNAIVLHSIAESNYYYFDMDEEVPFETAKRVLSSEQLEVVNSIQTVKDFNKISNGSYLSCNPNNELTECYLLLPTVFFIEETKVPAGYGKTKRMIPGEIWLTYVIPGMTMGNEDSSGRTILYREVDVFGDNDYSVFLTEITLRNIEKNINMEYGEVYPRELVSLDIDYSNRLWKKYASKEMSLCVKYAPSPNLFLDPVLESNSRVIKESGVLDGCRSIYIKNKKGSVDLELISYVNNSETTIAEINKELEYRIVVKNNGGINAYDSIVSTKLPEGFVVVDGSINREGELKDGEISWNILKVKKGEDVTLSFKTYPSNKVKEGQTYSGEATIKNFALENDVTSNKVNVKVSLSNNPHTWAPYSLIIIVLLIAISTFVVAIKNNQKTEENKE